MTYTSTPGKNSPALHNFTGPGLEVHFQDGPVGEFGVNGTTNEEVIRLLIDRINSLNTMQGGKFHSPYNDSALNNLQLALNSLENRTAERVGRGVEGTSVV